MRIVLLVLSVFYTITTSGQDTLSLTFIGDVMQHGPQIRSAYDAKSGTHNYDSCFKYLKDEMSAADFTIANLECTLAGPPFTGYPMFSAPDALASGLKNSGVDVLVTANNHTCDRRKKGTIRTIDVLDRFSIPHTGSFRNQMEKDTLYPLILEKNNISIALLNYTYGTNGMPIDPPTRVNTLIEDSVKKDLKKAKNANVDQIIVFVHWGSEYQHKPNQKQKDWAKLFFDNGADVVIGAHPHVVQPMIYQEGDSSTRERVLVYSLGNFVSNQRTSPRDGGAIFNMELVKTDEGVRITNSGYMLTWVWLPIIKGKRHYYVLPASKYEKDKQMIDTWSHNKMKTYIGKARAVFDENNIDVGEYQYLNNTWTLTQKSK